ncbi:MAG: hypothetical protein V3W34_20040, partial [Phycisphaerae bacterium]
MTNQNHPADPNEDVQEVPLCPMCFTPVSDLNHYCERCGEAVGRLTPYIPFVNIRFNYTPFATMWQRLWRGDGHGLRSRAFYAVMIFLFAPVMVLGIPFA